MDDLERKTKLRFDNYNQLANIVYKHRHQSGGFKHVIEIQKSTIAKQGLTVQSLTRGIQDYKHLIEKHEKLLRRHESDAGHLEDTILELATTIQRHAIEIGTCTNQRCPAVLPSQIQRSVLDRWPSRHKPRYTRVKVLLVRWESDDLRVYRELDSLARLFAGVYNFDVSWFEIPDCQPVGSLTMRVNDFILSRAARLIPS